jgi:hypothetical protein
MTRPAPQFVVKYNDYTLPGYAQGESYESSVQVTDYNAPYSSEPLSEQTGDLPKNITISMLVWDDNYVACKEQIQNAATYLRSKRGGYGNLYLGTTSKHYQVIPVAIKYDKNATDGYKTSKYDITFKAKPYLEADDWTYLSISGAGTFSTDTATTPRTYTNGIFSPCYITISGASNTPTISGYTETGEYCGYIAASGIANTTVTINSRDYTAVDSGGNNKNALLTTPDYAMFVGVGKTNFSCQGVSSVEIAWHDRWYI